MTGKRNSQLKALSAPVAAEVNGSPSGVSLDRFKVQSWDDLLPKLQLQAVILEKMPQTIEIQQALAITNSAIEMMEAV